MTIVILITVWFSITSKHPYRKAAYAQDVASLPLLASARGRGRSCPSVIGSPAPFLSAIRISGTMIEMGVVRTNALERHGTIIYTTFDDVEQ